ncbi:hypothetical protein D3C80_2089940 [compost metagenome]
MNGSMAMRIYASLSSVSVEVVADRLGRGPGEETAALGLLVHERPLGLFLAFPVNAEVSSSPDNP